MNTHTPQRSLLQDLWESYRAQPLWVQIWVGLVLVPVNVASLFFLDQPAGLWIAFLANIGMLMNLPVMLVERGFTRTMALPHLVPWTILVVWLLLARPEGSSGYAAYLWALLVIDGVSLLFDYPDSVAWLRERRQRGGASS